jgi:hypothetical protein
MRPMMRAMVTTGTAASVGFPREKIRDEIIPFHLSVYERSDGFGTWAAVNAASRRVLEKSGLAFVRTFPYEGPDAIEGSEHGEVEYALTKAEWHAQTIS